MAVVVGVLTETAAKETRVAVVPEIAAKLKAAGVRVLIERGAASSVESASGQQFAGPARINRRIGGNRADAGRVLLVVLIRDRVRISQHSAG